MRSWRPILMCTVLVVLVHGTGCSTSRGVAGGTPPPQWSRDERLHPWIYIGVSPTASSIEHALRQSARYDPPEECPLRLFRCGEEVPREAVRVDDVRCAPVAEFTDRCAFRFTEVLPGEDGGRGRSVRTRCTGDFVPLGTSHTLPEWGIDTSEDALLSCTPGR